jgi:hypothetical protein
MDEPIDKPIAPELRWKYGNKEFERVIADEYPDRSLDKILTAGYLDQETEKLWTFWLKAYWAGQAYKL